MDEQTLGNSGTLAQEVASGFIYQRGLLPTPTAIQGGAQVVTGKQKNNTYSAGLHDLAKSGLLPTPKAQEAIVNDSSSSQLNPRFVAEMMGFPHNWTELPFQNGEQNQSKDTAMP
jgi:hypothetical protein